MAGQGFLKPIYWYSRPDELAELFAFCPACRVPHGFILEPYDGHDAWSWDGSWERPTFKPSMLANSKNTYPDRPLCHSYLTAGVWNFLGDCTHDMAGQKAAMIPFPEDTDVP